MVALIIFVNDLYMYFADLITIFVELNHSLAFFGIKVCENSFNISLFAKGMPKTLLECRLLIDSISMLGWSLFLAIIFSIISFLLEVSIFFASASFSDIYKWIIKDVCNFLVMFVFQRVLIFITFNVFDIIS